MTNAHNRITLMEARQLALDVLAKAKNDLQRERENEARIMTDAPGDCRTCRSFVGCSAARGGGPMDFDGSCWRPADSPCISPRIDKPENMELKDQREKN